MPSERRTPHEKSWKNPQHPGVTFFASWSYEERRERWTAVLKGDDGAELQATQGVSDDTLAMGGAGNVEWSLVLELRKLEAFRRGLRVGLECPQAAMRELGEE